jgi:hypothetical protein
MDLEMHQAVAAFESNQTESCKEQWSVAITKAAGDPGTGSTWRLLNGFIQLGESTTTFVYQGNEWGRTPNFH